MPHILTRTGKGRRTRTGGGILAALAVAALCLAVPAAAETPLMPRAERDQTLVIGRITGKISKQYHRLEALNDYLVPKLAAVGITQGRVILANDASHMATLLETGQVDYFSETVFTALRLEMDGHASVLLHEWKDGQPTYKTLFIATKSFASEAGADGVAALAGQRVAFEDGDSTSGFLLPYLYLVQHGLKPVPANSLTSPTPKPPVVSYHFADDETSVLARVMRGRATAGTVSDIEWPKEMRTPAFRHNLQVIAETPAVLRSLTMVRGTLPADRKTALADALMALNEDDAAGEVKKAYFNTSKFAPLSQEARQQLADLRTGITRLMPNP